MENKLNETIRHSTFLSFPIRIKNCLIYAEIFRVEDLIKCSERDLLKIPNLGLKSLKEIKKELSKHDLCLNKVDTAWKPEEMCHRREKFETYLNNLEKSVGKCNGK